MISTTVTIADLGKEITIFPHKNVSKNTDNLDSAHPGYELSI